MFSRPQLKPEYSCHRVQGEGIILISELEQLVLQGSLYELVIPLLDGVRTVDEIIDLLQETSPAEIYYVLLQLEKKLLLVEGGSGLPLERAAWWSLQNIDPHTAARRLARGAVTLTSFGAVDTHLLCNLLRQEQVRLNPRAKHAVVLTDDYLRQDLESFNRQAIKIRQSWLLVKAIGSQLWFGPVFRPGRTSCWECLAQRLRANREIESYLRAKKGWKNLPDARLAMSPGAQHVASGLTASAVAAWIVRGELPELDDKIQVLDLRNWKLRTHSLMRRPQCSVCGEPGRADAARPLKLRSRTKMLADNGHRTTPPEETLRKFEHHVSPITGAISMLSRIAAFGAAPLHVYVSGYNAAVGPGDLAKLRKDLRSVCAGKGTSDIQAKTSGLCEALERYCGAWRGDEPRRRARRRDLGDAAIHPNDCMLFSERQYRERTAWNARRSRFNFVPAPFDERAVLDWTPVWSLTRRAVRYLPTAFCYFSHPPRQGGSYCVGCSSGNAAGNTLEEAVLHGFLELVERDSVALWWYNRVARPGVDLDSFCEPYLDRVRDFLRTHQRDLWVLDLTSDLKIPAFAALSRRNTLSEQRIVLGFGAHLDARVAVLRAVTELVQMIACLMDAKKERPLPEALDDPETLAWLKNATIENQPYLAPAKVAPHTASCYAELASDDLCADVLYCQGLVERLGLEMLVLDQTRADIGLPVVKVMVPGFRHFWARFAPGRLYEVPVQLGWLSKPLSETQLNPIAMFL